MKTLPVIDYQRAYEEFAAEYSKEMLILTDDDGTHGRATSERKAPRVRKQKGA